MSVTIREGYRAGGRRAQSPNGRIHMILMTKRFAVSEKLRNFATILAKCINK